MMTHQMTLERAPREITLTPPAFGTTIARAQLVRPLPCGTTPDTKDHSSMRLRFLNKKALANLVQKSKKETTTK
jgi:hypothetical protein